MSQQPAAASRTRFRRRRWRRGRTLAIGLLILLGLAAALVAGAWVYRADIAEYAVIAWLADRGVRPAELTIERIDLSGLRVREISIGPDDAVRVTAIAADYTFDGLRAGRLERLVLTRPVLAARVEGAGVIIRGLEPLFEGAGGGVPTAALGAVAINDFTLALETPAGPSTTRGELMLAPDGVGGFTVQLDVTADRALGPAHLAFNGRVGERADGGMAATGALEIEGTAPPYDARLDAKIDAALGLDGRVSGHVTLAATRGETAVVLEADLDGRMEPEGGGSARLTLVNTRLDHPAVEIRGGTSSVSVALGAGGLEGATADLTFKSARAAGLAFTPGRLSLSLADDSYRARAMLDWAGGRLDLTASGRPAWPAPIALSATGSVDQRTLARVVPSLDGACRRDRLRSDRHGARPGASRCARIGTDRRGMGGRASRWRAPALAHARAGAGARGRACDRGTDPPCPHRRCARARYDRSPHGDPSRPAGVADARPAARAARRAVAPRPRFGRKDAGDVAHDARGGWIRSARGRRS